MQPLQPDDPGEVGDYRLLARLGAGGMGTVYLGRSPGGRAVAVKVVQERFGRDAHYRARFRREVAAAQTVTGAFTAALLDAAPEAEVPWLVMEYLPGQSLREAVASYGGLPPIALRLLAAALAEALADIHRAGLAHRDLKPGNIMLTARGPRVIDFGIARPVDATAITLPGSLLGTPSFMSPEQASGGLAGPAGDVFALGAVLVFTATGQEPFTAEDRAATLARVRVARTDLGGITDRGLRALVAACLRREPERRPSAAAVLDRLGEPTASVHGTGWLPAPLAEAIDRGVARTEVPPNAAAPVAELALQGALPGETTADPSAVTAGPSASSGNAGSRRPSRRSLLLAAAAVPVAAGAAVALAETVLSASEDSPSPPRSSSSHSPSQSRTATARPAVATRQWKTKAIDDDQHYPDLYNAGDVVVATSSGQNDVHALDPRTGEILWSRAADTSGSGFITAGTDAVYLFDARDGDSTEDFVLRAVHPASGATRWTSRVPFFPWGTTATGSVLCIAEGNQVRALDAEDGRPRWTARATGNASFAASAALVVAGGDDLAGMNAGSGRIRWRRKLAQSPVFAVISDGMVFAGDNVGTAYAVRADDGTVAWQQAFDYRSSIRHAGNGLLYVGEADGRVRAFRAGTGKPVWSRRPGLESSSYGKSDTLGVSGGTLWVQAPDQTVYALDTADGRVLWTYGAQAATGSTSASGSGALAVDGLVLLGTLDGHVEAVNPPGRLNGGTRGAA
ncbi:PQQ-binding-like beta-propeller repeat protein [Streptomyces phaeochromogenes]|uniref:outer membrane protein assembly factor BamB family protein n=1 Tax=Streptomyces phaeochromogenes TaxID=1923 RepID=UPI00386E46D3|nr:serine/threonine-protein kinase [Streptomyces phaeochromogenes]